MLALARKFRSARSGSVSLIFALSLLGLLMMVGMGVDYAFYQRAQSRLQTAVDAAALAAGRMGAIASKTAKDAVAEKMFDQHISRLPGLAAEPDLDMDYVDANVTAKGTATIKTTLLRLAGIQTMTVHATSHVAGQPQITMALALDVTGSMRDQDIAALQSAAKQVVDIVTDKGSNKDNYISIVPFAAFVNIGKGSAQEAVLEKIGTGSNSGLILKKYKNIGEFTGSSAIDPSTTWAKAQDTYLKDWADKLRLLGAPGLANIAEKWFAPPYSTTKYISNPTNIKFPISTWELLQVVKAKAAKSGVTFGWNGCVEARPEPYDANVAEPTVNNPNTMFEPFFAYDGYGDDSATLRQTRSGPAGGFYDGAYGARNNGGNQPPNYLTDLNLSILAPGEATDTETGRTFSILKYLSPYTTAFDGDRRGRLTNIDQLYCPPPIEPLTNDKDTLDDLIDQLDQVNGGGTVISEGFMWAWRTIEDIAPFPRPAGAEILGNPQKIVLLMTDGENNINASSDGDFYSQYSAYGNIGAGQMPGVSTRPQAVDYIDGRTRKGCAAAKQDDVIIFTVLYRTNSTRSANLLKDCASGTNRFFMASDPASLVSVFQKIADDVKKLRITG